MHKPVNFASLTESFTLLIFKIIETLILNANAANKKQLSGPEKSYRDFRETGPALGLREGLKSSLFWSEIWSGF